MLRKAVFSILALATVAVASAQLNYAQRNVAIRAGVLVIDSQQGGGTTLNYNPFVWFNLDSNKKVLPPGWSFYNPVASTQVTAAMNARWTAHNTFFGQAGAPAVGDPLTKRDAPYWEVFLSTASDAQITSFDVLHLSAYGLVRLNPLEREKLRKFMEGGGVLWVDTRNLAQLDPINGLPIPFDISNVNLGGAATGDFNHPLLSMPHTVGYDSLFAMQSEALVGLRAVDFTPFPNLPPFQGGGSSDFLRMLPVASDQLGPAVMVGQVGGGFMVVTSRQVARTLNRTQVLGAYNDNVYHRANNPLFDRGSDAAAKLIVNAANLPSGHAQHSKGARKENSSPIDVHAPLLKRFDAPLTPTSTVKNYFPPVVYNGLIVAVSQDQIFVYDANPRRDMDGDGNPDDGFPDFALGSNEDLIWTSGVMSGPISPPACAEVPDALGAPAQQIAVTDLRGTLYLFNAFPAAPGLNMPPANTIGAPPGTNSTDTSLDGHGPYAPTYHDGQIFVADEASAGLGQIVGRVWLADARTGTGLNGSAARFLAGGSSSPTLPRPAGPAVVGYIPIADNSGGVDRVVYVSGRHNILGGPFATAGVSSLWVGAKGEKPTSFTAVPGLLTINTRASGQGLDLHNPQPANNDPLGIKITLVDANGNPLDPNTYNGWVTGNPVQAGGIITMTLSGGANIAAINAGGVRVDYTIDWGTNNPAQTSQLLRGQITLPDDPVNGGDRRRILPSMALSPQGTLHLVHAYQPSGGLVPDLAPRHQGGAFYSFREEGRGAFRLLNRWELYPQHTFVLNQAGTATVRETLFDNDELPAVVNSQMGLNILGGNFTNLSFQGGPAIHNGVVYVTARGYKSAFVPCSILLAFQAEPDVAQINVGDLQGGFTLLQPDMARSQSKTLPDQYNTLQPTQFIYEREPGSDRGTIRLDNLMATNRGPVQNAISRSQPIILRRSGQPDQLIEPDRTGSRWSPLLWYYVNYGVSNASPPTVTGKTVFFGGASSLPSILQTGAPFPTRGLLTGLDADVSPTDPFLVSNPNRPWLKQLWNLKFVAAPQDIRPNPAIRWPQSSGVTSFTAWAVRLLQTTLGSSTDAYGVVAGDGVLVSWGPPGANGQGLYAFSRADFLVADEGRLARFDPSGNPTWSSDASLITGAAIDIGSAADVKPLVRPTKAYALNQTDMLVVDTGSDRIIRMDTSGRELRSLDRYRVDPNFAPDGSNTNEPLTFKAPRDVLTFSTYETTIPFSNPSPTGIEYWVHYVVADTGNKRILELVDRYAVNAMTRRIEGLITDASGNKALGILYWHTPSAFSGKNFSYNSVARVYVDGLPTGRWVYAAGIGSALPTRANTGLDVPSTVALRETEGGNGGIVVFDGNTSQIISEVDVPAIGANIFYNPATGLFDAPARPARTSNPADVTQSSGKKLGNLTSVTMKNIRHPVFGNRVAIMFTDAEGVWEIVQPVAGGPWVVDWMLPNEVYKVMRRDGANVPLPLNPQMLRANYARRLDSNEVLVVNGYTGRTLGGAGFDGEVIQVDGDFDTELTPTSPGFNWNKLNLNFNTFTVRFELPPVTGVRGLLIPVFADRR